MARKEHLIRAAEIAYGSLDDPKWGFVRKRIEQGLYDGVADRLRAVGSVVETTDLNSDVGRMLAVRVQGAEYGVQLSLVGPFACITAPGYRYVTAESGSSSIEVREITAVLEEFGLEVLSGAVLHEPVYFGNEVVPMAEVLFSIDVAEE